VKLLQSDNKCQSGRLNGFADSGGYSRDGAQCSAGMCRCSVCQTVGYIFKEAQHYLGKPANSLPALTGRLKSSAGKINKRIIK